MRIFQFLLFAFAITSLSASLRADEPSQVTMDRATKMKASATSFALYLTFVPEKGGDKRYNLALSVPPLVILQNDFFGLHAQISEEQARKIIDHLAEDGYLHEAQDVSNGQDASRVVIGPSYILNIYAPSKTAPFSLTSEFGWGAKMLARLDALSKVLNGDAANRIQKLLAGLADERTEWVKQLKGK